MKQQIKKYNVYYNISNEEEVNELNERMQKIEELATNLRCELEDLADFLFHNDFALRGIDDDTNDLDEYSVQDWANDVSEIEQAFEDCE